MKSWIVSGYAIVLGIIIGLVSWLFLSVVYKGIHVVWHTVPEQFNFPFYVFLVPVIAGVCIGLLQRRYGRMPRLMPEVLEERKGTGCIDYRLIGFTTLTALLVLIGGASLRSRSRARRHRRRAHDVVLRAHPSRPSRISGIARSRSCRRARNRLQRATLWCHRSGRERAEKATDAEPACDTRRNWDILFTQPT